jgi:hypothetical protein
MMHNPAKNNTRTKTANPVNLLLNIVIETIGIFFNHKETIFFNELISNFNFF